MDVFDICQQIRMDAGKGKKCPGGYSIPANKKCGGKKKMRSPGGIKFSPKAAAVTGVLGTAGTAYAVSRSMKKGNKKTRAELDRKTAEAATGKSGTKSSVQDPGEELKK